MTTRPPTPSAADNASGLPERLLAIREFLAFKLADEEYGIDILRVQEIRSFEKPTRIARSPKHVLGVINLRGVIVPVIDLRVQLGMERSAVDGFTVVIVLHIGSRIVGMVVDGVSDVVTLPPEQLRAAPGFESAIDGRHLMGLGALEERMLILLDIDQLMTSPEMGLVDPGSD
ncbi:MAG: chemotaxis protein CheW [Rubrivivax sp.]